MFRKIMKARIFNIFKRELTDTEKLIKNIERYEQKKREEQSQTGNPKRDQFNRQKNEKIQK
jgi:hypothetical protein